MPHELPPSFFVRDGDSFRATAVTRGPWSNELQHGGPPCALLARAAERFGDDAEPFFLSRLTIDYLRPIPLERLDVVAAPLKIGSKAQRLELKLLHRGAELLRGVALRLRRDSGGAATARAPPPRNKGHHVGPGRGSFAKSAARPFGPVWTRQPGAARGTPVSERPRTGLRPSRPETETLCGSC